MDEAAHNVKLQSFRSGLQFTAHEPDDAPVWWPMARAATIRYLLARPQRDHKHRAHTKMEVKKWHHKNGVPRTRQ
jgi:hypothetical protein